MAKILYLDILKNKDYTEKIAAQSVAERIISHQRGTVYDRNLIPFTDRETEFIRIDSRGNVAKSDEMGVAIPKRYPKSYTASHFLGYISNDGTGLCGIEKRYDNILRRDGFWKIQYECDGSGIPLSTPEFVCENTKNSSSNFNLRTTLDYHIQKIADGVMEDYVPRGACVILDVKSFDILAIASTPKYDINLVEDEIKSDNGQLMNRALCAYNAGSVFKIITSAAALEANPHYGERLFYCDGKYCSDSENIFMCNKSEGHLVQTMPEAFAASCNCAFYETGICTGAHRLTEIAVNFGLGSQIAGMGNEESTGSIPLKPEYTQNETINLSIGQGEIMITPLQCAVMAATIANKGIRKTVNSVISATDTHGAEKYNLKSYDEYRVISEDNAVFIANMMRICVTDGTAVEASSSHTNIAGKTGSAESGWLLENGELAVHGWFCGFFPYENPEYAMAIICENGKSGAESCVKPFIKICEEINEIYPFIQ